MLSLPGPARCPGVDFSMWDLRPGACGVVGKEGRSHPLLLGSCLSRLGSVSPILGISRAGDTGEADLGPCLDGCGCSGILLLLPKANPEQKSFGVRSPRASVSLPCGQSFLACSHGKFLESKVLQRGSSSRKRLGFPFGIGGSPRAAPGLISSTHMGRFIPARLLFASFSKVKSGTG